MPRKRRANGEGCIHKRKNGGGWCGILTIGYDEHGKRKRRTVYGRTQAEVRQKLDELKQQRAVGELSSPSRMTVAEYMRNWIDNVAKPRIRRATYNSYDGAIRNHINPRIGGIRVQKLTPVHVQTMYGEMERAGASPRTRELVHATLRRALNVAVKQGTVPRNVCQQVEPPKVEKQERPVWTADQALAFLRATEAHRLHALFVLAITTGLRQGELFGLHWSDIDLDSGTLSVRRQVLENGGPLVIGALKTKAARRTVTLPDVAVEALHDHRAQAMAGGFAGLDLVFCDAKGGPLRKSNVRRVFKRLLNEAEVPDIRFHDLRHTAATLLLSQNVHPKIVQARMGHSKIAVTLDTYSHVIKEMDDRAADAIDEALKPKGRDLAVNAQNEAERLNEPHAGSTIRHAV